MARLELKQAQRSKAYLKLGMSAPSGGGKTLGALLIAFGMMEAKYPTETDAFRWSKIAIVDTENGSGELYVGMDVAGIVIGKYLAISLGKPYTAPKYTEAIEVCVDAGLDVCIIDSATHLWSGQGGLLEQQGNVAKRTGNSYTAWREITPLHNEFVEAMLQSPIHIISTMRAKQEYVQEKNDKGKTAVRKLGMEPEQRKGMEYEFTTFFEIDSEHNAFGSKDRTNLFDQQTFRITPKVGKKIMTWLDGGVETASVIIPTTAHVADSEQPIKEIQQEIVDLCVEMGGRDNKPMMKIVEQYDKGANPFSIKNVKDLVNLRIQLIEMKEIQAASEKVVETK